jgi:hypothetical protein
VYFLCFLCHSPTLRPWIDDTGLRTSCGIRRPSWRGVGARASRRIREIRRQKQTHIPSECFQGPTQRVFLSQAGPRFDLELLQAEHHLLVSLD